MSKPNQKADKAAEKPSNKAKTPQLPEAAAKSDSKPAEKLAELEQTIRKGLSSFVEVGLALRQINEQNLYEAVADSFADYCLKRWGMTDRYAYHLIKAANCMLALKAELPEKPLPLNEAQIRPICDGFKKPTKWIKAWKQVLKDTEGKEITAEKVEQIVRSMLGKPKKNDKAGTPAEKTVPNTMLSKVLELINSAFRKRKGADEQYFKSILEQIRDLIQNRSKAAQSS